MFYCKVMTFRKEFSLLCLEFQMLFKMANAVNTGMT